MNLIEQHYEITDPMIQGVDAGDLSAYESALRAYDVAPGDLHIDRPISNVLLAYRPLNFIADKILPIVTVNKQSDLVPGYTAGQNLRNEDTRRAPGNLPNYVFPDVTSQQYYANPYFLGTWMVREEVKNDDAWNISIGKAMFITDLLMVGYEIRTAALAVNSANAAGGTNTASAWTDWTTSKPLSNVTTDLATMEDQGGYPANKVVFGKDAWRNFRNSDQVSNKLFPHGGGIANKVQVADLLEVEEVIVGGAYQNTAAQGASQSLSKIWGDHVVYIYVPKTPQKWAPSWGYGFRWIVPGQPGMTVRRFPWDDKRMRQDMHVGYHQDEKILDTNMAYIRYNVNSSQ